MTIVPATLFGYHIILYDPSISQCVQPFVVYFSAYAGSNNSWLGFKAHISYLEAAISIFILQISA